MTSSCWFISPTDKRRLGKNRRSQLVSGEFMWKMILIHLSPYVIVRQALWYAIRQCHSLHKGQWRGALMFSLICALNKRLSKQSWGWWFETPSRSLWCHCNDSMVSERRGLFTTSQMRTLITARLETNLTRWRRPRAANKQTLKQYNGAQFAMFDFLSAKNLWLQSYIDARDACFAIHKTRNRPWKLGP